MLSQEQVRMPDPLLRTRSEDSREDAGTCGDDRLLIDALRSTSPGYHLQCGLDGDMQVRRRSLQF
jgi:hypothetical protein